MSLTLPPSPANFYPSNTHSLRYYIVWTARILLPIIYLLSTAKFVIIPLPTSDSEGEPAFVTTPLFKSQYPLNNGNLSSAGSDVPLTSAILIITHSRDIYLARTLHSVFSHHPGGPGWPIIISKDQQDSVYPAIDGVIAHFRHTAQRRNITFIDWSHAMCYLELPNFIMSSPFVDILAYKRISKHYFWALQRVFSSASQQSFHTNISRVVIIEDDMEIASDFFSYFTTLAPMLDKNPDIYCISAWNDNGISSLSVNESQLHRTDFFPGLGWMLNRPLWLELSPYWPPFFWDDWMRHPNQTRNRQCIRPEVSRTANFGQKGVSQSFHYEAHVSKVVLSTKRINFADIDISYLAADNYFHYIFSRMSNATRLKYLNYLDITRGPKTDVIAFYPPGRLAAVGRRTRIMIDDRNGILRTSYLGVVVIPWNGYWAFIVDSNWRPPEGYSLGASECC